MENQNVVLLSVYQPVLVVVVVVVVVVAVVVVQYTCT